MNKELVNLLTAYLAGWKTIFDCAEWLAGVDWNEPDLSPENRGLLGRLELLATEVIEGLRTEDEFSQEAADIVVKATGSLYVVRPSQTTVRTASSSANSVVHTLEISPHPGAQSWSILPLLVSE